MAEPYIRVADEDEVEEEEDETVAEDEGMIEAPFSPAGVDIMAMLKRICESSIKGKGPQLVIKPRYLYFSRYVPNFVGSDFCQFLVDTNITTSLTDAQQVGQFLLDQGYIAVVTGKVKNVFRNDWFLFRFCVAERGDLFSLLDARERHYLHKGRPRHKVEHSWLEIPISVFTVSLGTAGVAGAWATMGREWTGLNLEVGAFVFGLLSALIWSFGTVCYMLKMIFQWPRFRAEWMNPIAMNVFPAWSMTLLSLSITALSANALLAEAIWWVATPVQFLLALIIATRWVLNTRLLAQMTPHMFLPVVGLALIPIAGTALGFRDIGALFFGVSLVFWIVLFTILMHRIFFVGRLPPKLVPSMFLSIAPPSLIGLAFYGLNSSSMGIFGKGIFGVASFFILLLLAFRFSITSVPFSMSWWAYTFPFASYSSLAIRWHQDISQNFPPTSIGAWPSFIVVVVVFSATILTWLSVFTFTIIYIIRRRLFYPSASAKHLLKLRRHD